MPTTNKKPMTGGLLPKSPGWAPSPDIECLARLLAERGFRLSRGTWVLQTGDTVPTVCIDRPEQPEWGQKWAP